MVACGIAGLWKITRKIHGVKTDFIISSVSHISLTKYEFWGIKRGQHRTIPPSRRNGGTDRESPNVLDFGWVVLRCSLRPVHSGDSAQGNQAHEIHLDYLGDARHDHIRRNVDRARTQRSDHRRRLWCLDRRSAFLQVWRTWLEQDRHTVPCGGRTRAPALEAFQQSNPRDADNPHRRIPGIHSNVQICNGRSQPREQDRMGHLLVLVRVCAPRSSAMEHSERIATDHVLRNRIRHDLHPVPATSADLFRSVSRKKDRTRRKDGSQELVGSRITLLVRMQKHKREANLAHRTNLHARAWVLHAVRRFPSRIEGAF